MAANPNGFGYWLRNGSILRSQTLGKVAGTADFSYWSRDGSIVYPAAIQPIPAVSEQGINVMIAAAVMRF